MKYDFRNIESKWQKFWNERKTFHAEIDRTKEKYYVLDMFPYPSGSGLHVGHPLGYIASDIVARYKRHKGFNVLHPMGWDAFGLPAEQYALQTGTHPSITTAQNIVRYKEQLMKIGFSFDWEREINTTDPNYYKWTQWIFLKMFNSWFDKRENKAKSIETLIEELEKYGNTKLEDGGWKTEEKFSVSDWKKFSEEKKHEYLSQFRLAYIAEVPVNWCPELGTVLANEEVIDGLSERGGYPVIKKPMRQWMLRITAYAERLLNDLDTLDWPDAIKEMQRNWIGRSEGAYVQFKIQNSELTIDVFTTRPDTLYGATFMILAPEHELVEKITANEQKGSVKKYADVSKNRSERDRIAESKQKTGVFTGAYAINPLTNKPIPVWVADYVLASYGTGAIMCVPAHDQRDWEFAMKFNLEVKQVVAPLNGHPDDIDLSEGAYEDDENTVAVHSSVIDGLKTVEAKKKMIQHLEEKEIGKGAMNYKLRDWLFSRQRYWGEPIPIVYKNNLPYAIDEKELPVKLPDVTNYEPSGDGNSPLAKINSWVELKDGSKRETNTMPQWAGSCWYFLRYLDYKNDKEFLNHDVEKYWMNIDLYVGGAEHAVLHLLYARFWTKILYDLGYLSHAEPFQKLVNQGMILGTSALIAKVKDEKKFVSRELTDKFRCTYLHADVSLVENDVLNIEAYKKWAPENADFEFVTVDGKFKTIPEIEKMSKSLHNVVNPDDIIEKYGADCLRMYEMFLGPISTPKPWNTQGIDGVFRFLNKAWKLFFNDKGEFIISNDKPAQEELKALHALIKKVDEDIRTFNFNTAVSAFMIFVNEMQRLNCNKREILEPFLICLSPFAPHFAEELWEKLAHKNSIAYEPFSKWDAKYLQQEKFSYPVQVNGKMRLNMELDISMSAEDIEKEVLANPQVQKWLDNKPPKKVIVVPKRIVNVVV